MLNLKKKIKFLGDIAVISQNEEELQRIIRCMEKMLLSELKMKRIMKKLKDLVCSRNKNNKARIHQGNNP